VSSSDLIVMMGVSGSGKTSIGRAIAAETGWDYVEGDSFLTGRRREAAEKGVLGEDAYLELDASIGRWIDNYETSGRSAVVACSALRRRQRDVLREGRPDVRFCHLTAGDAELHARVGRHGQARLDSDLAALEPLGEGERGVTVVAEGDTYDVARRALAALGLDPGHS
jgi:gluconokinase